MDVLNLLYDTISMGVALALLSDDERQRVHWVDPLNSQRLTWGEFICLYIHTFYDETTIFSNCRYRTPTT